MLLNLTLKRKWFDMILSGEKKEEYRDIKEHWASRFLFFKEEMDFSAFDEMLCDMRNPTKRHNDLAELLRFFRVSFKPFTEIKFRNGYSADSPRFVIPCGGITIGKGREEWGAPADRNVFILSLGAEDAGKIDIADHIHHIPTGEDWVVKSVDEKHVEPAGWPPCRANLSDCRLIKKATPGQREEMRRMVK